jgi:predicted transcriptional regulator
MSALARASAIVGALATVFACVGGAIGGPLALLLGIISLERIRASQGALRGRWAAWTGISLGSVSIVLTLLLQWGIVSMQRWWNDQLDAGVRATFAAVDLEGGRAALSSWSPSAGSVLDVGDVRAFADEARARYGSLTDFTIRSEVPKPDLMSGVHSLEMAVKFDFETERLGGVLIAKLIPSAGGFMPKVRLESIRIDDEVRGALTLGSLAGAAEPAAPEVKEPAAEEAETAEEPETAEPAKGVAP